MSEQATKVDTIPGPEQMLENAGKGSLTKREPQLSPEILEKVISQGDLSRLSAEQRNQFYLARCRSAGLDPAERPFEYIKLNGQLRLYARKECACALIRNHKISHEILSKENNEGSYEVWARAKTPDGQFQDDCGVVHIAGLKGDALANAKMKAVTKAKRRSTLSLKGIGELDETELETIPNIEKPLNGGYIDSAGPGETSGAQGPPPIAENSPAPPKSNNPHTTLAKRVFKYACKILGEDDVGLAKRLCQQHVPDFTSTKELSCDELRELSDWLKTMSEDEKAAHELYQLVKEPQEPQERKEPF